MNVGDRIQSIGDDSLRGVIVSAPAPRMRRILWDDGESGDVHVLDIRPESDDQ